MTAEGKWVSGYELLCFRNDGLLTIRSKSVRELAPERWRDPREVALLARYADQN